MDLTRSKIFTPIHRDQQSVRKQAEALQLSLAPQHLQDFLKQGKDLLRFYTVQ
jgi:hypothetical protein